MSPGRVRSMRMGHRIAGPQILRRLRVTVTGAGLVPAAGPAIVAGNHISYLDNYLVAAATPRAPWFLGKAELAEGIFGWFNQSMGMVPVERGKGDRGALETAAALLDAGEVVALFPEGTRSPDGRLHKFRSGMARIAAQCAAPVVPVGVRGTTAVWPYGEKPEFRRPPRGLVQLSFGPPIGPPAQDARSRRLFTQQARNAVAKLSGQQTADAFAPLPAADDARSPVPSV